MKYQFLSIISIISLFLLISALYLIYLKREYEGFVNVHDFTDMTTDVMQESRAQLSEIATLLSHIGKPIIPPEERKIWRCNKNTGYVFQSAYNCTDKDNDCMTEEIAKQNCRYAPLPSSYWNISDQYTRESNDKKIKQLENDIDRLNLRHQNVYIPPATNTCKLGCTFIPDKTNISMQSNKLWKCKPHEITYTQNGLTNDYFSQELCRKDIDCIWCNSVGVLPINTQTQAERENDNTTK